MSEQCERVSWPRHSPECIQCKWTNGLQPNEIDLLTLSQRLTLVDSFLSSVGSIVC